MGSGRGARAPRGMTVYPARVVPLTGTADQTPAARPGGVENPDEEDPPAGQSAAFCPPVAEAPPLPKDP